MNCISRYTDDTYAQQFGDGRHKFYLEFRCNRLCIKGMSSCAKCIEKSTTTTLQHSRKFDHKNVNEPIPNSSHIFGGKWYYEGVKKWGAPPSEIVEFALQYQKEARGEYIVEDYNNELSEAIKQSDLEEMARAKKEPTVSDQPKNSRRKPQVVSDGTEEPVKTPVKRTKKPTVAPEEQKDISETKRKQPTKKTTETPYSALLNNTTQLVHKEVSLPTHLESSLEEFDTDGFKIEYVKLTQFEVNGATYFRDSVKNKLYKKVKDKGIGAYVGRWNPDTDMIVTDIPDSDDEDY
jgi:hypothetical protein